MREFSVPAAFTIGEYDNVVSPVYTLERDDPNHVAVQRLVDGTWTDVTSAQIAAQVRAMLPVFAGISGSTRTTCSMAAFPRKSLRNVSKN